MFVVTVEMCNISCFIASVKDKLFGEILGFGVVYPHAPTGSASAKVETNTNVWILLKMSI